jgi:hypothetical protein
MPSFSRDESYALYKKVESEMDMMMFWSLGLGLSSIVVSIWALGTGKFCPGDRGATIVRLKPLIYM